MPKIREKSHTYAACKIVILSVWYTGDEPGMKRTDPNAKAAALWLKQLNRKQLHEQGWIEVNRRFHSITRAARPFINCKFPDEKERQAAFDGFTLALILLARKQNIQKLAKLYRGVIPADTKETT